MACGSLAAPASAQPAIPEATGLQEVVVTARKQTERLVDAPVAVTALTADQIQQRNITSLEDVSAFAPSLTASSTGAGSNNRAQQTLVIRGMTPPGQTSSSQTTTVFINGAPLSGAGVIDGISDLAQVEVIKGPQSAYFGRQTFGGAVNLITKPAQNAFQAQADVLYGSDNLTDTRFSVEGAIVPDRVALRVAGRYYSRDGQYSNPQDPGSPYGSQSSRNLSIGGQITPTNDLRIKFFGLYVKQDDGVSAVANFNRPSYNCNAGGAPAGALNFVCGVLPDRAVTPLGQNTAFDPAFVAGLSNPLRFDIGLDHGGAATRVLHGDLTIDYTIPRTGLTLTSVTAGNDYKGDNIFDGTNQFVPASQHWLIETQNASSSFSQELRISSDQARRFWWFFGGNYEDAEVRQYNQGSTPFGLLLFSPGAPLKAKTSAAFGSAAYTITPKWILNLEGRYQVDEVSAYERTVDAARSIIDRKTESLTDRDLTWRAILQYKIRPRMQIYATWSRGVNPSAFNNFTQYDAATLATIQRVTGAGLSTGPEKLNNYELGFKGEMIGGNLIVDADVYYAEWIDQIVQQTFYITVPGQVIVASAFNNSGDTTLRGIEANVLYRVTSDLKLEVSGSINDSRVGRYACSFCAALVANLPPNTTAPATLFSGNQLPNYSKYNATFSADYTRPLTGSLSGFARLDYVFKSGMFESVANLAKTQDVHRVNVRLGVRNPQYAVEVFATNLFNNRAFTSIENSVDVLSPGLSDRVINAGLPVLRQVGVQLRARF